MSWRKSGGRRRRRAHNGLATALVTAASPAMPGEYLVMYLAGLGATNPTVKSGERSPAAEPLACVVDAVTVTVDGGPSDVIFAGLTPGGVGLYQINFQIPADARAGSLRVVVKQKSVEANIVTVPVVR